MPASDPLPTVKELEQAFHAAVGSEHETEDAHDGSFYDRWSGLGALTMRRIAERDQEEARALYFDTAPNDRLDDYIDRRFGVQRVNDTAGMGFTLLSRPNATAGAGTFLRGTRIQVGSGNSGRPRYWLVAQDTLARADDVQATVPIVASVTGPAGQLSLSSGSGTAMSIVDPLWDSWQVQQVTCGPGTMRQKDPEVRAAIRQARFDGRPGFENSITDAMTRAGASVIALFRSDFLGDANDFGLNRIYVGDSGFESPPSLLTACRLAVPGVCVAGSSVQVLPMTNSLIYLSVAVTLWTGPERLNGVQAQADATASVVEYFARRNNAFLWSSKAIRAAVMKAVPNVHSVQVSAFSDSALATPVAEPSASTLFDTSPLPRFSVAPWTVSVTLSGPS